MFSRHFNRELKQATFLTTRTLIGSKFDVFDQSRRLIQPLWRPCCQKRRLLKVSNGVYDRPLIANGKLFQDNCSLVEDMGHGILKSNMN